jgi:hypothetical protein
MKKVNTVNMLMYFLYKYEYNRFKPVERTKAERRIMECMSQVGI